VRVARELAFDTFQQIAPREAAEAPVRIADIDDASLAEIGQWPWSRDVMARLATRLTELGAAAVVFDVLFPEPDRTSPAFLNQWLSQRGDAEVVAKGRFRPGVRPSSRGVALGAGVQCCPGRQSAPGARQIGHRRRRLQP
jgi:adenylate cyclase